MEKPGTPQLSCMHPHDQAALISWRLVGFGEFQASRDAAFCIGGIQGLAKAWLQELRAPIVWCRSGEVYGDVPVVIYELFSVECVVP